ncbi:hypothetical protein [Aquihabitans sp. McL0605]|uniref:hypothetical protein n=1 Tax=Aquihabitans sp. McL0605 TaxID=3415671 RepID=UPI003CE6E995
MTDHPTSFSDDELSAAIDGEADADLQARIDADPDASARQAELRAASDRVAGSPIEPLPADTVDDLIASALDAPMAPAKPARAARSGPAPWLVAAGVAVLMAIGLSLIWAGRSSQDDQASSTAAEASTTAAAESSAKSDTRAGGHGSDSSAADAQLDSSTAAPTTTKSLAAQATYLGDFATGAKLREALGGGGAWTAATGSFGSAKTADVPAAAAIDRCAQQLQVTLSLADPPVQVGYGKVGTDPVLVYEFSTTSVVDKKTPATLVAAVGVDACDQVVIFQR